MARTTSDANISLTGRIHSLRRWAGIDKPIFYVLSGRVWGVLSGPVTIYLIALFLTPEAQGYYYTFGSVLALQVFLELGFSQCLVQFASHEFARLSFLPGGRLQGDEQARSRLISLGRLALKWYGVLALLLFAGVGLGGQWFFAAAPERGVAWCGPWWLLCLATSLNLCLLPLSALLEGCNQLNFLYGLRLSGALLASLVTWCALASGASLYTAAATALSGSLLTLAVLWRKWHGLLGELSRPPQGPVVSWQHEIWPFQWRIALSWMSGYFIFNLFNPVLFYFHGPVMAGRMGMTLQVTNSLSNVASSWFTTKGPQFGMLISQQRFGELDRIFRRATLQALGACALGGLVLGAVLMWIQRHYAFGARFLGLDCVGLLLAVAVVNQLVFSQAVYLRAHKREPFLVPSVVAGVVTGVAVVLMGKAWGALGACLAYALIQMAIAIWATLIWARCRRQWHASP
jgi:hypothetical protein